MKENTLPAGKTWATLLFSLILLFFFQLTGAWIESIYRMSLVKLAPGKELYGLLFVLLPLLIILVREKSERPVLWVTGCILLLCRLVFPGFGAPLQIVVCGLGMAMCLIFFAYAFSARYASLKGNAGCAVVVAILLSIGLRSWGSSVDVSIEGMPWIWGSVLVAAAALLFYWVMRETPEPCSEPPLSWVRMFPVVLGLFCGFTLIYLMLSCPLVVGAWIGYERIGQSGALLNGAAVVGVALSVLLLLGRSHTSPLLLLPWNLVFSVTLVVSLLLLRPVFPALTESTVVYATDSLRIFPLFLGILLLSGVVPVSIANATRIPLGMRPRHVVIPLLFGMFMLLAITLLLIATNVWGYVPLGMLLRNHFYLPFLVAVIGMFLSLLLVKRGCDLTPACTNRWLLRIVILIALLAAGGTFIRYPYVQSLDKKTDVLTVMTYNMQQGSHENGDRSYTKQLELLQEINPDVLGLQECDTARPSGGNVDAVRFFAESMNYQYVYYGPTTIAGTFGTAILSRYPISNSRTIFTYSDIDEIGTAVCEIDVYGEKVLVFCCHPAGGYEAKNALVDALIEEKISFWNVIAFGDFNFRPNSSHYKKLSWELRNSAEALGKKNVDFHGDAPNLLNKIDHIFIKNSMKVIESHYLPPPQSQTDHPAHWSVMRLR
jgi:endonuclease/exonuclease/phosphatase family metal-dependent hydrolase